ncbi:MAG TPA: tRNA dihydrouridine synthase DusB [Nitrospiraceae bacterium]|nr:tRNA dihydrouridine synthase DusB [Nitrospiraceae bacterium]
MSTRNVLQENPLVLAPMAGITDFPFRTICRELGAGLLFSEMISAEALIRNHSATQTMLRTGPAERPLVFQIFGGRPDSLAKAASMLSRSGADFIDINMGCPVPKVLKSGAGSALLKDMSRAREIMSAVVEASDLPVTVKIRLGWDAQSIIAVELAQAAEQAGIAAVTVHARTRSQGFSGHADWDMIKVVKSSVGIPVIGNGDVRSAEDARRMRDETGCDGVMIGRACQGYPWIFREARQYLSTGTLLPPPTPVERGALAIRHLRDMMDLLGEFIGVREMRKHLCWYTKGLHGGAEFRERVNHLANVEDVKREIGEYFQSLASGTMASQHA